MTEEQYKRLMRRFNIIWWIFGILVVLLIFTLATGKGGETHYTTIKGESAPAEKVDYQKIKEIVDRLVHESVSRIPTPTNGRDGKSVQGERGADGEGVDYEKVKILVKAQVCGLYPENEECQPAPSERQREYRVEPQSGQREWRYVGDRFWQVCDASASCEVEDEH